jgi:hypothetical protein
MSCKHQEILDLFHENAEEKKIGWEREYWKFTELFVYLHNGKDWCDCNNKKE